MASRAAASFSSGVMADKSIFFNAYIFLSFLRRTWTRERASGRARRHSATPAVRFSPATRQQPAPMPAPAR